MRFFRAIVPELSHINGFQNGQIVTNVDKKKNPGIVEIPRILSKYKGLSALAELSGGSENKPGDCFPARPQRLCREVTRLRRRRWRMKAKRSRDKTRSATSAPSEDARLCFGREQFSKHKKRRSFRITRKLRRITEWERSALAELRSATGASPTVLL